MRNISEGPPLRKSGTRRRLMDLEDGADRLRSAAPVAIPQPLALPWLLLSLPAIGAGALAFSGLCAGLAALVALATLGRDGFADLIGEIRFDFVLKQQLGALAVSLLYVGLAVATVAAAVLRGRPGWRDLVALRPMRPGRAAWRDTLGVAVLTLGYIALTTTAAEHARDHTLLVSGPTNVALITTLIVNLVLLAPLAEELLFRGWIYTALRRGFSFWPSYLATLVLFAGIHWDPSHTRIVQVLPLAAALGLVRERAGSIKPTIALHAIYNLVIIAIRLAYT